MSDPRLRNCDTIVLIDSLPSPYTDFRHICVIVCSTIPNDTRSSAACANQRTSSFVVLESQCPPSHSPSLQGHFMRRGINVSFAVSPTPAQTKTSLICAYVVIFSTATPASVCRLASSASATSAMSRSPPFHPAIRRRYRWRLLVKAPFPSILPFSLQLHNSSNSLTEPSSAMRVVNV